MTEPIIYLSSDFAPAVFLGGSRIDDLHPLRHQRLQRRFIVLAILLVELSDRLPP